MDEQWRRYARVLTFQLLIQSTSRRDGKRTNELFEVDSAVLVLIKYVEDIVGELSRVAEGEELFIDLAELVLVELTGGTVLEEALIPAREMSFWLQWRNK